MLEVRDPYQRWAYRNDDWKDDGVRDMKEKEILIFGTGQFAQIIKRYLEEQGKIVAGFTVNKSCIPHPRGGYIPSRQ